LGYEEISRLPFGDLSNISPYDNSTGEIGNTQVFELDKIKVVVKSSGYGYIQGSLHYFKNNGVHNYDDFTPEEFRNVIERLNNRFNIKIDELQLVQLEYGLNFIPPISTDLVLESLFYHKGVTPKHMYVSPGSHIVFDHSDYSFKNYNKAAQFHKTRFGSDLMRTEVHFKRARILNELNVFCLSDLKDANNVFGIHNFLLETFWNKVIQVDPRIKSLNAKLSNLDNKRISKWVNPNYWSGIPNHQRTYQKKCLIQFHGTHQLLLNNEIQSAISNKSEKLYLVPR
jgi:hypothetical protein